MKLFKWLRFLGIGAAGTIRTIYIKREEMGDKAMDIKARIKGKKKVPAEAFLAHLMDLKKTYKN